MRKTILGAFAALSAAAGGATAQAPARPVAPVPLAPTGAFDTAGGQPIRLVNNDVYNPAVPPVPGPPGGPTVGPMGGLPSDEMPFPGPAYPPGGVYGRTPYDTPVLEKEGGLFDATGPTRFFLDGQYLLLFPKDQPTRFPLLTTSAPADFGRVGASTTTLLAGRNGSLDLGTASGFRVSGGLWRADDGRLGVEMVGLYMGPVSYNLFARSSDQGIPLIARPFMNAAAGNAQASLVVSSPNAVSGSALVRATTEFYGVEANALYNLYRTAPDECRSWELNLLAGYRYLELEEELHVSSRSTILAGTLPVAGVTASAPSSIEVRDSFSTLNKFHGAQVGVQSKFTSGRWYVGTSAKAAFGGVNQAVTVDGSTALANPAAGTSSVTLGGLFANASNIGRYRDDRFAVVTDLNATLGFHFTRWLTGTVGYNFVHLSAAARPGNLFDGRVDPSLVPTSGLFGTAGPANRVPMGVPFDDFFVHGLNFGVMLRY